MGVTRWEGMSPSLEKSKTDTQCTSRLTQGRYQTTTNACCTGENSPPPSTSSGLEMSGWFGRSRGGGIVPGLRQAWESSPTSLPPLAGSSTMDTLRSGRSTQPSPAASMSTHPPAASLSPSVVKPWRPKEEYKGCTRALGWSAWGPR